MIYSPMAGAEEELGVPAVAECGADVAGCIAAVAVVMDGPDISSSGLRSLAHGARSCVRRPRPRDDCRKDNYCTGGR